MVLSGPQFGSGVDRRIAEGSHSRSRHGGSGAIGTAARIVGRRDSVTRNQPGFRVECVWLVIRDCSAGARDCAGFTRGAFDRRGLWRKPCAQ
jgi:hypothetical protein